MKLLKTFLLTLTIASSMALAGGKSSVGGDFGAGNGGDEIRYEFIYIGKTIVNYLKTTAKGLDLTKTYNLDIMELEKTLNINRIQVTDKNLYDNRNSIVAAIVENQVIHINEKRWASIAPSIKPNLIFHEMLRSSKKTLGLDDNYIISKQLNLKAFTNNKTNMEKRTKALFDAIALNNFKEVQYWVNQGAWINSRDLTKRNSLLLAIDHLKYCADTKIIDFLLKNGAFVDMKDNNGQNALHYAAKTSCPNLIKKISNHKYAQNIKDNNGF